MKLQRTGACRAIATWWMGCALIVGVGCGLGRGAPEDEQLPLVEDESAAGDDQGSNDAPAAETVDEAPVAEAPTKEEKEEEEEEDEKDKHDDGCDGKHDDGCDGKHDDGCDGKHDDGCDGKHDDGCGKHKDKDCRCKCKCPKPKPPPPPPGPPEQFGRMTGGGSFFCNIDGQGTIRVTHGFQLRCDEDDVRQNLEINWNPPGPGSNNFHLLDLTSATCTDEPGYDEEQPNAGFDTFSGEGTGTLNGQPATIEFVFTDEGEPGRDTDRVVSLTITQGMNTYTCENDPLNSGNHQAHPQ